MSESGTRYDVGPLPLRCTVCQHDGFHSRESNLSAPLSDSVGPTTECLICARCGYVHWFVKRRDDTPWNEFTKRSAATYDLKPSEHSP